MSSDGTRIFLFWLHPIANQMDQNWYHANRTAISLANLIIKTKTKPLLKFCDTEDLSLLLWVQKNLRVWCASRQVGWWPLFFSSAAQCTTATSLNKNSANTQHLCISSVSVCRFVKKWRWWIIRNPPPSGWAGFRLEPDRLHPDRTGSSRPRKSLTRSKTPFTTRPSGRC